MELTKKERVILANQYSILRELDKHQKEHYDQVIEILENGYAGEYFRILEPFSDELSLEVCGEVKNILDMYRMAYNAQQDLGANSPVSAKDIKFKGFDGNNETELMAYARFLIETEGRWTESKTGDLNSHFPMLSRYRGMLKIWEKAEDKFHLTPDELKRIFAH